MNKSKGLKNKKKRTGKVQKQDQVNLQELQDHE